MRRLLCCTPRQHCSLPVTIEGHDADSAVPSRPSRLETINLVKLHNTSSSIPNPLPNQCEELDHPRPWRMSPLKELEELDQLVIEDDSDTETGPSRVPKGKNRLEIVKDRLIRHISREDDMRRPSLGTVGTSDQDIARRAELRRLRHERIQKELEDNTGDNAARKSSNQSHRYLSRFIELCKPASNTADSASDLANIPDVPCRKYTAHSPQKCEHDGPTHMASIDEILASSVTAKADRELPKPADLGKRLSTTIQDSNKLTGSRDSFVSLSSKSISPGIDEASSIFRRDSQAGDRHSALGVWLLAQGLTSRDSSLLGFKYNEEPNGVDIAMPVLPNKTASIIGVTTIPPTPASSSQDHAITFETWKQWTNRDYSQTDFSKSSSQGSLNNASKASEYQGASESFAAGLNRLQLEARPSFPELPPPRISYQTDNISSQYSSLQPTSQPSPARSKDNFHHLSSRDLDSLRLSPFQYEEIRSQTKFHGKLTLPGQKSASHLRPLQASEGQSSYVTANDNLETELVDKCQNLAIKSLALQETAPSNSDTSSVTRREAELETISDRFRDVLSRQKPNAHMSSRFKEDFSAPAIMHKRSTFLSRLHRRVPGLSKSEGLPKFSKGSLEEISDNPKRFLDVPTITLWPRSSPSFEHILLPTQRADSTTEVWKRAIQLEQQQHDSKSNHSGFLDTLGSKLKGSRSASNSHDKSSPNDISSTTPQSITEKQELSFADSEDRSRWILQQWVTEARGNQADDLAGELAMPSLMLRKRCLPPESWASHPSHTRQERYDLSKEAGVVQQDFAIRSVSSPLFKRKLHHTNDPWAAKLHKSRTLSSTGKLTAALKSSLKKLLRKGEADGDRSLELKEQNSSNPPSRFYTPTRMEQDDQDGDSDAFDAMSDNAKGSSHRSNKYSGDQKAQLSLKLVRRPETPGQIDAIYTPESVSKTDNFQTPLSRFTAKESICYDTPTIRLIREEANEHHPRRARSTEVRGSESLSTPWANRSATQPLFTSKKHQFDEEFSKLYAEAKGEQVIPV